MSEAQPAGRPWVQGLLIAGMAIGMVAVGVRHFTHPEPFVRIVPPFLPAPEALVAISGVFEILGGVGVVIPATRRWAALGLIALFVAVFPANLYMAWENVQMFDDRVTPAWAAWARLPLQAVFIAWAWAIAKHAPR